MSQIKKPLKSSILKGIVLFITALCVCLAFAQYITLRQTLYAEYRNRITNIIGYATDGIDTDDLAECIRTGEESEQFRKTQAFLDMVKERTGVHFLYIVLPLNTEKTDNMRNIMAAVTQYEYANDPEALVELNALTGDAYSSPEARKYLEAFQSGHLSFFENTTAFGADYTGLLPLADSEGNPVAALCVDFELSEIHSILRQNMLDILIIVFIVGLLFATVFILWSDRNLIGPIRQLEKAMTDLAARSQRQRNPEAMVFSVPEIRTGNEVESLARATEKVSVDLRNYMKNQVDQEKELARLSSLANRDELTHVGNRSAYEKYAENLQLKMTEEHLDYAILLTDTSGLKQINDDYGHEKGDLYLQKSCRIICETFRHSPVFRIGGDVFAVILRGEDYMNRGALIDRARAEHRRAENDEKAAPWERVVVALGLAEYDEATDRMVAQVYERAEAQLKEAKERLHARADRDTQPE